MKKEKSRIKWARYEGREGQTWKVAVVIMVIFIIVAGYFVIPKYITPVRFATTFTDTTYKWVFQETPNVTTMTGNGVDGNWTTYEELQPESNYSGYTFNTFYTRSTSVGAIWKIKDDAGTANYTLPAAVVSEPIVKIQGYYNGTSKLMVYQVYYALAWHEVTSRVVTANKFYDDGLWWQFVA